MLVLVIPGRVVTDIPANKRYALLIVQEPKSVSGLINQCSYLKTPEKVDLAILNEAVHRTKCSA